MISDDALDVMDRLAREVGFGSRDDYPHLGQSPISAGDWQGLGIVACVFAHRDHARRWLETCKSNLVAADEVTTTVVPYGDDGRCVAVTAGTDLQTSACGACGDRRRHIHAADGRYVDAAELAALEEVAARRLGQS